MEIHPQSSKKEPFVCVCVCFDLSHKLSQELMTTLSLPEHKGRESLADDQDRLNWALDHYSTDRHTRAP